MDRTLHTTLRMSLLFLLVVWGGYTYLTYIGVPVHQAVLLSSEQQQAIADACGQNDSVCAAWRGLGPVIQNTFARVSVFGWYIFWSAILYGVLLTYGYMRTNRWKIHLSITPLKLILTFLGLLWILFMVISHGGDVNQPYRRLYMPSAQVYPGADPHTLEVITEDYNQLKERGCLTVVSTPSPGLEVADLREGCIQQAFFTRVLSEAACILYLLFVLLSMGRQLLQWLRVSAKTPAVEALFSVTLGACGLIVLLWTIAVAGAYTQLTGLLVLLVLPLIFWQQSLYWLRSLTQHRWEYEGEWYSAPLLLSWVLLSYLLFNFLTVVRPFPIGWDDLGVYLNDPRLLVSYGHFIPRMGAFQWEYITSLGFLLFGYNSYFGATTAMMINWMAGLLAVCSVYVFASLYLGPRRGYLAALIYYTLPLVGHFSFADMKVDNAVFTMGVVSMLAGFLALFPTEADRSVDDEEHEEAEEASVFSWPLIILAGIFGGFGFAMKPTTIMVVMSLFTVIFGALLHATAFVGGGFLAWIVFTYQGVFYVKDVMKRLTGSSDTLSRNQVIAICAACAAPFLVAAVRLRPQKVRHAVLASVVFLGVFGATISPWILHNNVIAGNLFKLTLRTPNFATPTFLYGGEAVQPGENARVLSPDLKVNMTASECTGSTSKAEELDRYWGYGTGISHYFGLPWRLVMNADSVGYYVTTTPALLLFPLLLLLPYFWTRRGRWLRYLFAATVFLTIQWIFFANGVPWYGIGMFLGMAIGLEALVQYAPDRSTKIASSILLFLSFIIVFGNRFWQFESQRNLYTYAMGAVSGDAMQERTIPHYNTIRDIVLQRAADMPETPYVYRVGTFIPYFIPKNLEILPIADNQLDVFTCINQEKNPQLTLKRLKGLGFNSIIFDTNTQTIERDPNGSLHKKVQAFLDFVNTQGLGLNVVISDVDGGVAFLLLP